MNLANECWLSFKSVSFKLLVIKIPRKQIYFRRLRCNSQNLPRHCVISLSIELIIASHCIAITLSITASTVIKGRIFWKIQKFIGSFPKKNWQMKEFLIPWPYFSLKSIDVKGTSILPLEIVERKLNNCNTSKVFRNGENLFWCHIFIANDQNGNCFLSDFSFIWSPEVCWTHFKIHSYTQNFYWIISQ